MKPNIKAIIFDFGNVVGHFDYGPMLAQLRTFTELSDEEIRATIDRSDLPDAFETGHVNADQFLDGIIELCQIRSDCDRGHLAKLWSDIFTPNPAVCDLIPRLRPHYRLLLGSNTNELHSRQFRRQFANVLDHFDGLVLSFEIKAMKPDPRFFQHCHQLAGCEAAECVFIDDLAPNIDSARAYGLQGIVYHSRTDLPRELTTLGIRLDGGTP